MSGDRARLEEYRDQALRDIVDLERQVRDGEIPADRAEPLREGYERAAARAMVALEEVSSTPASTPKQPRSRGVLAAYALAAVAGVLALAVVLPGSVGQRPAGGFVTGNEAVQGPTDAPGRYLSTVTDAELEAVLQAQPEVISMRIALAGRYTEQGNYDRAAAHYVRALEQDPDDPEAQAHFGWLLLQLDRPREALRLVERARRTDPSMLDALWFEANIRHRGLDDPAGALAVLAEMRTRDDLSPVVRQQVTELTATARREAAGR